MQLDATSSARQTEVVTSKVSTRSGRRSTLPAATAALAALAVVTALLTCFAGAASADSLAGTASARNCQSFKISKFWGTIRVYSMRVNRTSCPRARRVVRNFYSQTIGSSGATIALNYGCRYWPDERVTCSPWRSRQKGAIAWVESLQTG